LAGVTIMVRVPQDV